MKKLFCEEFPVFVAICLSYSTVHQTMVWICSLYWLFLSSLVCINFVIRSRTLPIFFFIFTYTPEKTLYLLFISNRKSKFLSFHFIRHNRSKSTLTKNSRKENYHFFVCVFFSFTSSYFSLCSHICFDFVCTMAVLVCFLANHLKSGTELKYNCQQNC